jgi:hypothetical protein
MVAYGISQGHGIEMDPVKCDKAKAFMHRTLQQMVQRGSLQHLPDNMPQFTCAPVEKVGGGGEMHF